MAVVMLSMCGTAWSAAPLPDEISEAVVPHAAAAADPPAEAEETAAEPVEASSNDAGEGEPPDIRVSPSGTVEMHVRELDLGTVLQMLSIQSRRNIIASNTVSGSVTANLYEVTFEEALTAILAGNNCTWREKGNFIYVHTVEEANKMEAASRLPVSQLFRLRYTRAADAQSMIQPLLSADGKVAVTPAGENGIPSNSDAAGGDAMMIEDCLLVIDYPENIDAIARMISQIDLRPRQILVEATILRAQLNEDNALGIDFNVVGGVDFSGLTSTSPGVTELNTGTLFPIPTNTVMTNRTDFNDAVPDGGYSFGVIKNSTAVFVRALESITDTSVLANPKVMTLNKQRGEVIVGRRDGYLTTTVTETATVQSVDFLETGTRLIFRPFIGDDGYIRMEVHPEDSTGGITASNLPFEQTTEVTTNIMVRDGHTILIGGLFREVSSNTRGQVPLVGNIPIAGMLFRNTRDTVQREEVIILLTVHVVKDDDLLSESLAADDDVERFRVGMRQGSQFFGRERLGQAHYKWALEHLENGHLSKALWDLDLAINNNPKFLAAIKLKEKLLDQRLWEEDSSDVRGFLNREIMKEQGVIEPPYGRPGPPFHFPGMHGPNGFEESFGPDAGARGGPVSQDPADGGIMEEPS